MFCAISGEIPQDPVVSKKTGHLYEKRLIEKYLQEDGKCPVSGESMDESDLVSVKANKAIRPRPLNATSIPGMLALFQNEWDELTLETFTLKQHLDTTRQELSQALYQHDAACRVIAKLMRERDEARAMLGVLSSQGVNMGDAAAVQPLPSTTTAMEEEGAEGSTGLDAEVVTTIMTKCTDLSKGRRARKPPADLSSREVLVGFLSGGDSPAPVSYSPHETSKPGVTCLATPYLSAHCDVVLTGGNDKKGVVSEVASGRVIAKLAGHSKKVSCCALFGGSLADLPLAVTGSADNQVKVWRPAGDGSSYSEAFTFTSHSEEVTGVCVHPTERFAASVSRDGTWCFLDVTRGACLMQKGSDDEDPAAAPYSCGRFHPDGLLLAAGTTGGAVRIWDIREQKSAANCADHAGSGAVLSLSFSENGYLFASGGEDGSAHIWDLRKLQAVKSLPTGDGGAVTAVAFDLSGTYLAMGSSKGSVSTTVVKEWTELTSLALHKKAVSGLAWANSSASALLSSSLDRTVKLLSQSA